MSMPRRPYRRKASRLLSISRLWDWPCGRLLFVLSALQLGEATDSFSWRYRGLGRLTTRTKSRARSGLGAYGSCLRSLGRLSFRWLGLGRLGFRWLGLGCGLTQAWLDLGVGRRRVVEAGLSVDLDFDDVEIGVEERGTLGRLDGLGCFFAHLAAVGGSLVGAFAGWSRGTPAHAAHTHAAHHAVFPAHSGHHRTVACHHAAIACHRAHSAHLASHHSAHHGLAVAGQARHGSLLGLDDSRSWALKLEVHDLDGHGRVFQLDEKVLDVVLVDEYRYHDRENLVLALVVRGLDEEDAFGRAGHGTGAAYSCSTHCAPPHSFRFRIGRAAGRGRACHFGCLGARGLDGLRFL